LELSRVTLRQAELFRRTGVERAQHRGTELWRLGLSGRRRPVAALFQECVMLGWAITFLIVALVAAIFGFGGIAAVAVDIARIIFVVAIILFVISAVVMLIRGRSPTLP